MFLLALGLLICNPKTIFSQNKLLSKEDIENYKKKYFNSNFNASGVLDLSAGLEYHKENNEFINNYRASINANLSIYGCSVPINYIYTNGRSTYDYNLNTVRLPTLKRFGVSPEYKWIKLHLGYRTMDFSKYTYSGGQFKGVGLELTPGNFELKYLQGTLRRSSADEDRYINNFNSYYSRYGTAISLGYKKEEEGFKVLMLKAYDDENSLTNETSESLEASENTILSFQVSKKIIEKLSFDLDFAYSAFTPNKTNERIDIKTQLTAYNFLGLFQKKEGSHYDKAYKSALTYELESYDINITYEEVDPQYRTLGSLFFNNNYKNYTIGSNFSMLDGNLDVNGDLGIQTQYLDIEQTANKNRLLASIGSSYKFNEKTKVGLRFSNNQSSDRILYNTPGVSIDSINLVQTNLSLQANLSHIFGEEDKYSLNLATNYKRSSVIENEIVNQNNNNSIYGGLVNLNHKLNKTDNITYGINANVIIGAFSTINNFAPNISYSKTIKEKINLKSGLTYNLGILQNETRNTLNLKTSAAYNPNKKLSLSLENSLLLISQQDKSAFDVFLDFKSSYKL